jgi:hypothetical protein
MRGRLISIAVVTLIVLLASSTLGAPAYAQTGVFTSSQPAGFSSAGLVCSGGISGAVVASDTNGPLELVTVTARLASSDFAVSVETDISGHYTIAGLPAGQYQVQFEPDPSDQAIYLSEYYDDRSSASAAKLVQVTTGAATPGIDAALNVGGTISGTVIGAGTSIGLSDVFVNIYTSAGELIGSAFTDASGVYTTDALPSGSYKVEFVAPDGTQPYLSEFFNNQPSMVTGSVVAVAAPNDTPNINATLDLGGQIRGILTAANGGAGLADVAVVIYTSADQFVASTFTDGAGNYASTGLRAGSYKLRFLPSESSSANAYLEEYYNHKPDRASASLVAVTVPNPTTVNTALSKGGQFTGQVTAAGSGPLADVEVQIYSADGQLVTSTITDASGNYLTPGLAPGSYKLLFDPSQSASATGYAYEYNNNKPTFALADLVAAPPPTAPASINAVLDAGGRISGRVTLEGTDICGNAFDSQGAEVTVYDSSGQPVATTQPDAAGDYITPALPTGSYHVGFDGPVDAGFVPAYYHDKPTLALADLVSVTVPNTTPNINATLIRSRSVYLAMIRR